MVAAAPFAPATAGAPATDDWAAEVAQEQWNAGQPPAAATQQPNWGGAATWD